ncbi:MAG: tautomerase family protein [Scytonema sp. PMC 1069.18]|nr:tautomerase family protein [Scytonema sp. PMC 1069.18]MEC4882977.1 tautomerase family protein [Scytonema sp. PMC 1070.18]
MSKDRVESFSDGVTTYHISVKLYPGRSEQQKIRLAEQIMKDVVALLNCGEESVSLAIKEIERRNVLEFITNAVGAQRHGTPAPSLLPMVSSSEDVFRAAKTKASVSVFKP